MKRNTIITTTGDIMIGEIKSLSTGVLYFDAAYADKDFNITWDEIDQVYSQRSFLVLLSNDERLTGRIKSQSGNLPTVVIATDEGDVLVDDLREITQLTPIEKNFLGRLNASLEIGYTYTKSNNNKQFSTRKIQSFFLTYILIKSNNFA
jgi:hypothetical protein